jgi:hypothetical protein
LQIVALPETMDALEASRSASRSTRSISQSPACLSRSRCSAGIGLLILQVLKVAGGGEVHVIEPLAHRRAAALGLRTKEVAPTADDIVTGVIKGARPLVSNRTTVPSNSRTQCAPRRFDVHQSRPVFASPR